jgi:putative SOS response-associated peptidase YedK|tara:strand:+ start:281 stop:490 length:210 start_codon:yes stop_codon:yes gene_type:complete
MQADSNAINIHHRQPVIINKKNLNNYFNPKKEGTIFLKSYRVPDLKFHPASKDANNPINDTKELIEELK